MTRVRLLTLAAFLAVAGGGEARAERAAPVSATVSLTVRSTPLSRRAAIDGPLGRFSSAEAMTQRDPRVRMGAAERLGRFGPVDHALDVLHDALTRETDLEVRFAIVRALGRRGDPRSVPVLIDELQSGSDAEVLLAVDALRAIGGEEGARGLVAALAVSLARPRAIESCVELGALSFGPLVAAVRLDPGNVGALEALAGVLEGGATPTDDTFSALSASASHSIAMARAFALRALGATGETRAASIVRTRFRDDSADVVRAAFEALGRVGERADVAVIRDHVVTTSPYFLEALRALLRLDPEGAHRAVADLLPTSSEIVRTDIANAVLAASTSPDTLALLIDTHAVPVISALAESEDPRAIEHLRSVGERSGDISLYARAGLAVALRRRGDDARFDARTRALLDEPLLRAVAGDDSITEALDGALASDCPGARAHAALGLEWLRAGEEALEGALARETSAVARRAECDALEATGASSSAPFLDASLTDPRFLADCGVYIARALPEMSERRRRAFRVAFRRALRAPDERLATTAARALAVARDLDARPALRALLESGSNVRRLAAARALAALTSPDELRALARSLDTPEARRALTRVLGSTEEDVLWVVVSDASRSAPYEVDLVGEDGYVRRTRSTARGLVFVRFPAGGAVDVRVVREREAEGSR